jgi:phosphoribosylamine--glycine ligase
MSKVVIIDNEGVMCALAFRAAQAGHDVKYFIEPGEDNNAKTIGKGLHANIEKVKEWLPHARSADLVVTGDNAKYLDKLSMLRARGVNVFAPSQRVADLEIKRGVGLKFLEDHGIEVPEYTLFKTLKEAEQHVLDTKEQYVFKTLGDEEDKSLTFVGKSPQQLVQQLRDWQAEGMTLKGEVMLQKFVKGMEFAVASWVGKNGFIGLPRESFEHKKLYAGEKGQNTGEMGTVMKYVKNSALFDEVLKPLEEDLVKMGAFTNVDVNCIIDKSGKVWPLEFTCRFGWPQFNLDLFAIKGDPIQWMIDACQGDDSIKASSDVIVGVCLVVPDFPVSNEDRGLAIYGITDKIQKHIQPQFIKAGSFIDDVDGELEEVKGWVTAGSYVAIAVNTGKDIDEAIKNTYKIVDEISISNLGYRTDIGVKVQETLPALQKLGFASEWQEYEND